MALKKCRECGKEVSSSAEACPHCGARLKNGIGCIGTIAAAAIFVLVIFVVVPVLWYAFSRNGDQSSSSTELSHPDIRSLEPVPPPAEQFCDTLPPTGYKGFVWGAAPTSILKKKGSSFDGLTTYQLPDGAIPGALFGVPVSEELFTFSDGKFSGVFAIIEGEGNAKAINAELVKRFGPPSFVNESGTLTKWKWKERPVSLWIQFQEKFGRTTVSFSNEGQ